MDEIFDPETTLDGSRKMVTPPPGNLNLRVLNLIPFSGTGSLGITREEIRLVIWPDDHDLREGRQVDPDLDQKIKGLGQEIRNRQWMVNRIINQAIKTSIEHGHRKGYILRMPGGRLLRNPDCIPQGGLADAVVEVGVEKVTKQERVKKASEEVHSVHVKRRKTARDVDLEDHLRLRHPTGTITADNLLAYFAIQGVMDPRTVASVRLARLVTLDVVERVGPSNSGVYRLLPAK